VNTCSRKVIAACEAIGGVAGALAVCVEMARAGFRTDTVVIGAIVLGLFILSLYAGIMLWRDKEAGYVTSIVVQFAQLPKIIGPKLAFAMSFGFDFMLVSVTHPNGLRGIGAHAQLPEQHTLFIGLRPPGGEPSVLGISVVSCVVLWLLRSRKRTDSHSAIGETPKPPSGPLADFKRLREIIRQAKEEATS
jgi:hypothetical protein